MLAHDRSGTGPPLVLLHGVGLDRRTWRPVRDLLSEKREVIALDLPGHGESPSLPAGARYDVAGYVGAVREAIGALGLDRPHVAGNSLGGAIALELARTGEVASAVALSPIGFWNTREIRSTMASLRLSRGLARLSGPIGPTLASIAAVRLLLFRPYYGHPARLSPADARAAAEAFAASAALPATLPYTRHYRFAPDPRPRVPVTIGWGRDDRLLPPRQALRAREILPAAWHVILPGCGHVPMPDDPERVASLLLSSPYR
ncbi:alpha/beta fold hydrolase [Actinoallomurus sp. NPDC050550]|uniref:alpha/beta fold hydrolase n=1 Tax=Actinoallomurus sp. NPDC050550 TaxID=3154937 RepID=UPI003411DA66